MVIFWHFGSFPQTSRSNAQNWYHHQNLPMIPNFEHYLPPTSSNHNFRQTLSLLLITTYAASGLFATFVNKIWYFCHFFAILATFWLFPTIQSLFKQNLSLNGSERQMRSKRSDAELYTFFPFRKKTLLKRFFPQTSRSNTQN